MAELYRKSYDQAIERNRRVYTLDEEKLCFLTEVSTKDGTESLADALTVFYSMNTPYSIETHLENHGIKYKPFHFY